MNREYNYKIIDYIYCTEGLLVAYVSSQIKNITLAIQGRWKLLVVGQATSQVMIQRLWILLHTYTDLCNFPSCHTTFLHVVKSNFVYTITTYLSAELEERSPHWSSRASIIRRTVIIEDKRVVT